MAEINDLYKECTVQELETLCINSSVNRIGVLEEMTRLIEQKTELDKKIHNLEIIAACFNLKADEARNELHRRNETDDVFTQAETTVPPIQFEYDEDTDCRLI